LRFAYRSELRAITNAHPADHGRIDVLRGKIIALRGPGKPKDQLTETDIDVER
jgi:hypothetical protein